MNQFITNMDGSRNQRGGRGDGSQTNARRPQNSKEEYPWLQYQKRYDRYYGPQANDDTLEYSEEALEFMWLRAALQAAADQAAETQQELDRQTALVEEQLHSRWQMETLIGGYQGYRTDYWNAMDWIEDILDKQADSDTGGLPGGFSQPGYGCDQRRGPQSSYQNISSPPPQPNRATSNTGRRNRGKGREENRRQTR